jgi:hypothetical protein
MKAFFLGMLWWGKGHFRYDSEMSPIDQAFGIEN